MQRLRRFLTRELAADRLADRPALAALGVRERWVPETIEAFDEVELALPLDAERDAVLTLAVEEGKLARILLGWAAAGDDDADTAGFDEEGLAAVLERHGETLERLLEHLTGG
ncbi:MAG: hypothetical protein ACYS99_20095 [Planctomycetota bacterium]|jgi:hypothetical protein